MKFLEQLEKLAQKYKSTWGGDDAGELFCTMLEEGLAYGTKIERVEIVNDYNLLCARARNGLCEVLGLSKENIGIADYEFIKPNTVYDVIFGGTKYTVTAIKGVNGFSNDEDTVYIGAYDNTFEDGKTPFNITFLESTERFYFWWPESIGKSVKVSINKAEIVEPINYKYMPEGYPKVETQLVEILPEQSVTDNSSGNLPFFKGGVDDLDNFTPIANHTYTVVVNGEKMSLTCMTYEDEPGYYEIDVNVAPTDGKYFAMMYEDDGGWDDVQWGKSYGETITLAIYEEKEVVQQIDPKFVGGDMVVTFNTTDGQNFTADKTLDELLEAVKNGVNVVAKIPNGEYSNMYLNMSSVVFEGGASPKQMGFISFQIVGNGKATFFNLNYHSTAGIGLNTTSYTPQ